MRRLLATASIALAAALAVAAPTAHADGDPASDVLATADTVFIGMAKDDSRPEVQQLRRDLSRVNGSKGGSVRVEVAIIDQLPEMGSVAELFNRPGEYATFLGDELRCAYAGSLVIVMPGGVGVAGGQLLDEHTARRIAAAHDPGGSNSVAKLATVASKVVGEVAVAQHAKTWKITDSDCTGNALVSGGGSVEKALTGDDVVYLPATRKVTEAAALAVRDALSGANPEDDVVVEVAVITDPTDMARDRGLWGKPQEYASLLASRTRCTYSGSVVVAMPAGVGISSGTVLEGDAAQRLAAASRVAGSTPDAVARAGADAAGRVGAWIQQHPVKLDPPTCSPHGARRPPAHHSRGSSQRVVAAALVVVSLLLVAGAGVVLLRGSRGGGGRDGDGGGQP